MIRSKRGRRWNNSFPRDERWRAKASSGHDAPPSATPMHPVFIRRESKRRHSAPATRATAGRRRRRSSGGAPRATVPRSIHHAGGGQQRQQPPTHQCVGAELIAADAFLLWCAMDRSLRVVEALKAIGMDPREGRVHVRRRDVAGGARETTPRRGRAAAAAAAATTSKLRHVANSKQAMACSRAKELLPHVLGVPARGVQADRRGAQTTFGDQSGVRRRGGKKRRRTAR